MSKTSCKVRQIQHKEELKENWYMEGSIAALNAPVQLQEILQHFISPLPSLKSNSWHLEQIDGVNARSNLFDRLGRKPRKVCARVCMCVCMQVEELLGCGLVVAEAGNGHTRTVYITLYNVKGL